MRIVENGSDEVAAVLTRDEVLSLEPRIGEARDWVGAQGLSLVVSRDGEGARIAFPDKAAALSFLGTFVPGALAEIVRPIADGVADSAEVSEKDGAVEVSIRYVGDAGDGQREPHRQSREDYSAFADLAREEGFETELRHTDHDTIEAVLRPAEPSSSPMP